MRCIKYAIRLIAVVVIGLSSWQCSLDKNHVVMEDVSANGWDSPVTLHYNLKDQLDSEFKPENLSVMLRVCHKFKAEQLGLEITTMTPDSLSYSEQVILPIDFEWQGSISRSKEIELPYRRNVELRLRGEYIITLRPTSPVEGIESVGINFKSTK